jgi:hypothetical protein
LRNYVAITDARSFLLAHDQDISRPIFAHGGTRFFTKSMNDQAHTRLLTRKTTNNGHRLILADYVYFPRSSPDRPLIRSICEQIITLKANQAIRVGMIWCNSESGQYLPHTWSD